MAHGVGEESVRGSQRQVIGACDVWKQQREFMATHIKRRFGGEPKVYADYRAVLADKDIDAVIIATPDHQHCGQLRDSVRAGKDVYVEKPIAMAMDELNEAYDAVKASKAIVQHGTQGRSSRGAVACKALYESGRMGKLFRVESTESAYRPYWNHYACPEKESDTNWKEFLYGRPHRPFDRDQHGSWMGYHEFSSGPIGGWMSHYSDFVHFMTGCGFPQVATAHGGIFAPTTDRRRTAPDTATVVLEYAEGFVTEFTTHFGSGVDNETTTYYFEKGTLRCAFGHNPHGPRISGEGSEHPERPREEEKLELPKTRDHMLDWFHCIRTRETPAAHMDAGYMHGVAVVMGDMAFVAGRKMKFDAAKRRVVPV